MQCILSIKYLIKLQIFKEIFSYQKRDQQREVKRETIIYRWIFSPNVKINCKL